MAKIKYLKLLITTISTSFLFSCDNISEPEKEKLSCDNNTAIVLVQDGVKKQLVESWALKLAADNFQDDIRKRNYQGSKFGFFETMSENFKEYLLQHLANIKSKQGHFYNMAVEQYSSENILVENIITDSYDSLIDRCECTASIALSNSNSKNRITYGVVRDSKGSVTILYKYRPKAMIDEKNFAIDFIRKYEDQVETIPIQNDKNSEYTDDEELSNQNPSNLQSNDKSDFYIISTMAVKDKSNAMVEVEKLKEQGYEADYLWIPDFKSLSGKELYTVYIGPFQTQKECEKETEKYRKINSNAFGLLVSNNTNDRVQINGINKVIKTKQ